MNPELDIRYFQLTTSILLRRAYCTSRPWDQWILLASLKILHGQETPMLDSVSLHLLQGTSSDKFADCDFTDEAEENADLTEEQIEGTKISLGGKNTLVKNLICDGRSKSEVNHNSPKNNLIEDKSLDVKSTPQDKSSHENTLPQASISPSTYTDISITKDTSECNIKSPNGNNMNEIKHVSSYVSWKQYSLCKDKSPQKNSKTSKESPHDKDGILIKASQNSQKKDNPGEDKGLRNIHHACQKKSNFMKDKIATETYLSFKSLEGIGVTQIDASMQVTPKKLGIYVNKWAQVKLPRIAEQGVQTELLLNSGTQTKSLGTQTCFQGHDDLSSASIEKEVQTVLVIRKDKSTQVDRKTKTGSQPSRPVWRMVSVSGLPKGRNHWAHGSKWEVKNWGRRQKDKNHKALGECLEDSDTESDGRKDGWLFHGRPLLNNDETKPLDIPIDCLESLSDFAMLDPRLSVLS